MLNDKNISFDLNDNKISKVIKFQLIIVNWFTKSFRSEI